MICNSDKLYCGFQAWKTSPSTFDQYKDHFYEESDGEINMAFGKWINEGAGFKVYVEWYHHPSYEAGRSAPGVFDDSILEKLNQNFGTLTVQDMDDMEYDSDSDETNDRKLMKMASNCWNFSNQQPQAETGSKRIRSEESQYFGDRRSFAENPTALSFETKYPTDSPVECMMQMYQNDEKIYQPSVMTETQNETNENNETPNENKETHETMLVSPLVARFSTSEQFMPITKMEDSDFWNKLPELGSLSGELCNQKRQTFCSIWEMPRIDVSF